MHIPQKTTRGLLLAATAASLFALAPLVTAADAGANANGACFGVNACKGKSSCKTANNGCKGLNACKGKGFVEEVSEGTCAQLGGQFKTYPEVEKEQAGH
ncbi:MAG TPA: hypothetical protein VGT99_08580 [Gammaproteobacteria bacterium]|nr:hypothetical protein [Gammaproteobacteria bacterium]